jgi:hypothetical protein
MSALGLILVSVWGGGVALRHLHRLQALEVQCLL